MAGAQQSGDQVDAHRFDQHEDQHARQDQLPFTRHRGQVQRHADAQEEQAQEDAAERLDLGLQLMAEGGLGQQHAGQEGAHGHRQAAQFHQQRRAQHHQQRGGGHHFAGMRGRQQAEQGVEQPAPGRQQRQDATDGDGRLQPGIAMLGGACRRQQRHQGQQGHDGEVFEQQDGNDALALGAGGLVALAQYLHDDGGGRQHETHRRHEGRRPRQSGQQADRRQQRATGHHLGHAQAEDFPAQLP